MGPISKLPQWAPTWGRESKNDIYYKQICSNASNTYVQGHVHSNWSVLGVDKKQLNPLQQLRQVLIQMLLDWIDNYP